MSAPYISKSAAVLLAVLLMAGTIGLFIIMTQLGNLFPDEREQPHDYYFEGTLGEAECIGEGSSKFIPESEIQHVYIFSYDLQSAAGSYNGQFTLIFDENDRPVDSIYRYVGTEEIGGIQMEKWTYDYGGVHYLLYIGKKCLVYQMEITSGNFRATGYLSDVD